MLSEFFSREEVSCNCGCGFDSMDIETLEIADEVRRYEGAPVVCSSGCRCAAYNEEIGGAPNSQHVRARAMDLHVDDPANVYKFLCDNYKGLYGFGLYEWGVHIDTRTNGGARWQG